MSPQVAVSRAHAQPIDPTSLAKLRRCLFDERDAQRSQLVDLHATLADVSGESGADNLLTREMAEQSVVRCLAVIAEIEHAFRSLAGGTYGTCERCNGAISLARLEAIPYARHCISCPPPALLF
jgi:RNA polymerase-binding transcription factor DksA